MRSAPRIVALLAAVPLTALGADVTRIASSFEPGDPFGMFLDLSFVREQHKGAIVREIHQAGDVVEVPELRYLMIDSRFDFDLRIGIWQDVEIKYSVPVILSQTRTYGFASGIDAGNSSITNNCLAPDGTLLDPNCLSTGAGKRAIFDVPNASYRGGVGNMHFGLNVALFNEHKDPSKPMWLVGIDYEAPTATLWDPTVITSEVDRGGIGDRIHKYSFFTAFSKRLGVADPYFKFQYTLPFRGPGWYSNCDHPDAGNMSAPLNCGTGLWTREETGIHPPHTAGVLFGSEFELVPSNVQSQRVALDARIIANYVSEGRTYNPLTDVLGKLLDTGDHLDFGGALGITAQASENIVLKALTTLLASTEYTLTQEQVGKDVSGDGKVQLDNPQELNPNFDWRYDAVSRRFRMNEAFTFRIDLTATFSF
ncbi:MAG TPA: hypothetical protein VE782_17220 [Myxococcaceae bacterium]|nr:hypothetical protein [Myxococcaceae bacterium]